MNTVDHVALWVGLISSIVSIVLSVVAVVFAVVVDRSARAVTAQTIKSLQKIESDVERLSGDTRELIKAGWDRMLGSVTVAGAAENAAQNQLAAGIAAELKTEFAPLIQAAEKSNQVALERRLDDVVQTLESALASRARRDPQKERRSAVVDDLRNTLDSLSPEAFALAAAVSSRHIEPAHYRGLREGPLGRAVMELRRAGLLEPHVAFGRSAAEPPVYFFPKDVAASIRSLLPLVPAPDGAAQELVAAELKRVGYATGSA